MAVYEPPQQRKVDPGFTIVSQRQARSGDKRLLAVSPVVIRGDGCRGNRAVPAPGPEAGRELLPAPWKARGPRTTTAGRPDAGITGLRGDERHPRGIASSFKTVSTSYNICHIKSGSGSDSALILPWFNQPIDPAQSAAVRSNLLNVAKCVAFLAP